MNPNLRNSLKYSVKFLFYATFIFFVLFFFLKYAKEIIAMGIWPSWYATIGSLFFTGLGFLGQATAFYFMVSYTVGRKVRFIELIHEYVRSNLTRYTPGNVWSFIVRYQRFKKFGLTKKQNITSMLIEASLMLITSVFMSARYLNVVNNATLKLIIVLLLIIVVFFAVLTLFKNKMTKKFPWILVLICYVGAWVFWGIGWWLLASNQTIAEAIGSFSLSWLVGYASLVTPSGLGVREGMLVFLIINQYPLITATAFAIWSRLIYVLAEVIVWLVSMILLKKTSLPL